MGSTKKYKSDGGFTETEYKQTGTTANGIKIIAGKDGKNSNTPAFSNTPNTAYAKVSEETGKVNQVSTYGRGKEHRAKVKDIDTEHPHTNKINGMSFSKNDIHVHEYDKNGVRSKEARRPSKKERRIMRVARYERRKEKIV